MTKVQYYSAVAAIVVDIINASDTPTVAFIETIDTPMGHAHLQDAAHNRVQACTLMADPANHAAIIGHNRDSAALCRRYWDTCPASDIPSCDVTLSVTMARHLEAIATMGMAKDVVDMVDTLLGVEP